MKKRNEILWAIVATAGIIAAVLLCVVLSGCKETELSLPPGYAFTCSPDGKEYGLTSKAYEGMAGNKFPSSWPSKKRAIAFAHYYEEHKNDPIKRPGYEFEPCK